MLCAQSEHMAAIDQIDGSDPSSVRLPPPPPMACDDENALCGKWADAGECDANPEYMHRACAGSCNTCDERKVEL